MMLSARQLLGFAAFLLALTTKHVDGNLRGNRSDGEPRIAEALPIEEQDENAFASLSVQDDQSEGLIPGTEQLRHLQELRVLRREAFLKHTLINTDGWEVTPFKFGPDPNSSTIDLRVISVATQLSYGKDKFRRLLDLASRWTGYLSAVLYIDGRDQDEGFVESTIQKVGEFYDKHAATLHRVSIHIVVDKRPMDIEDHYPHNLLRNYAIDYAWTDSILLLDADFIPSQGSHDQLVKHLEQTDISKRKVLLLPAFEKQLLPGESPAKLDYTDLPPTKQDLLTWADPSIKAFHASYYPGHGPTNYAKWYKTADTYKINFDLYFEPYFIIHRDRSLPLFWEHFSGFGRNKQSWVEEVGVAGYEFHVNPDAFLIHINHGYDTQDVRFPRPSVLQEYDGPFQQYLEETYEYTFWDKESLREDLEKTTNTFYRKMLHICKAPSLFLNQTNPNTDVVVDIPYQCRGPEYAEFGNRLIEFAKAHHTKASETGMRKFPMPANSSALVLGNSHTQQVIQALICQYFDVVKEVNYDPPSGVFEVTFQNGANLVNMAETSVMYRAKGWRELLEGLASRSLESFDAILIGSKFDKANSKNEQVLQDGLRAALERYFKTSTRSATNKPSMKKQERALEDVSLRLPRVSDISSIYQGPMVIVTPFAATAESLVRNSQTMQLLAVLESKAGNKVVEMLDGRKYVAALGECGSYKPDQKRRCDQTTSQRITPDKMNRCVGRLGGHPDLIAWDVIEFFHREIVVA